MHQDRTDTSCYAMWLQIFEVQAALVSGVDESQLSGCADWLQPQHYT